MDNRPPDLYPVKIRFLQAVGSAAREWFEIYSDTSRPEDVRREAERNWLFCRHSEQSISAMA